MDLCVYIYIWNIHFNIQLSWIFRINDYYPRDPSGNVTWPWKIRHLYWQIIYKWAIFYSHVELLQGMSGDFCWIPYLSSRNHPVTALWQHGSSAKTTFHCGIAPLFSPSHEGLFSERPPKNLKTRWLLHILSTCPTCPSYSLSLSHPVQRSGTGQDLVETWSRSGVSPHFHVWDTWKWSDL